MTSPFTPAGRAQVYTLADRLAGDKAAIEAGTKRICGASCACHGGVVCIRARHPHDSDADMGLGKPRGDVVPHAGYDADGSLVQWVHTAEHGPEQTADEVAQSVADARREHTRGLLDGLDLAVLAEVLAAPLARALAEHRRDGGAG